MQMKSRALRILSDGVGGIRSTLKPTCLRVWLGDDDMNIHVIPYIVSHEAWYWVTQGGRVPDTVTAMWSYLYDNEVDRWLMRYDGAQPGYLRWCHDQGIVFRKHRHNHGQSNLLWLEVIADEYQRIAHQITFGWFYPKLDTAHNMITTHYGRIRE